MWHIVVLYAIFASTFTLGKAALAYCPPLFLVTFRMISSGLTLLAIYYAIHGNIGRIKRKDWLFFIKLSFFQIYFSYVTYTWALQYVSSIKAATIYLISPFFAAFFSYTRFKEKVTFYKLAGLILGAVGMIPTLLYETSSEEALTQIGVLSTADIMMIISAASFVYGSILTRDLVKRTEYSPILINGISMTLGGLASGFTALLFENNYMLDFHFAPILWGIITALSISNIASFVLNTYLLRQYTATFITFMGFLDPLFVSLYGMVFLGERISPSFFISIVIVGFGLYLFYNEELKQGYIVKK
ncbi:hypothetical protein J120_03725 [candidate division TM6 bacterium JCVI TM6SC1]|uniref:EamA domain-containing protein n=1 Tax=candidate division TM6 bacterium JCVI TM6SC1 TaxID=1306947 RepID=A0A0D2K423_9BACT|nr:hypothetical protein J120_03725 [candidate division TM6 bacterium JCVI TM6SC1]